MPVYKISVSGCAHLTTQVSAGEASTVSGWNTLLSSQYRHMCMKSGYACGYSPSPFLFSRTTIKQMTARILPEIVEFSYTRFTLPFFVLVFNKQVRCEPVSTDHMSFLLLSFYVASVCRSMKLALYLRSLLFFATFLAVKYSLLLITAGVLWREITENGGLDIWSSLFAHYKERHVGLRHCNYVAFPRNNLRANERGFVF